MILSKKEILTLPEDSTGANIHKAQRWKACNSKFLVLLMYHPLLLLYVEDMSLFGFHRIPNALSLRKLSKSKVANVGDCS